MFSKSLADEMVGVSGGTGSGDSLMSAISSSGNDGCHRSILFGDVTGGLRLARNSY